MSQTREGPGSSEERPVNAGDPGALSAGSAGAGSASERTSVACGPDVCPAGMCQGRGHVIVYGNPAMVTRFGTCVGMPAREAMLDLPSEAFELLDAVYERVRPLARWVRLDGERWRMTAVPRIDAVDGEVYGVSFHLQSPSARTSSD
jgi:hypothetical protein